MTTRRVGLCVLGLSLLLILGACGDSADTTVPGEPNGTLPGSGTATGPGISVSEALANDSGLPLLANGFIVTVPDGTVYLSEVIAESYPPQPGGSRLVVEGLDLSTVEGLRTDQGISWTDEQVQLLGTVAGDTITVAPASVG